MTVEQPTRLAQKRIAAMQHDLRTPLSQIHSLTQQLLENETDHEKARCLASILAASWLAGSIGDRFASTLFNNVNATTETITPGELFETLRFLSPRSEGVTFEWDKVEPEKPIEISDFVAMNVASILMQNASSYAHSTSVILRARFHNSRFEIDVEDQGPAIPAEEHEEIFSYRQRGSTSGKAAGSGLGLWHARLLATEAKGNLTLRITKQGGNCFTLSLPWSASSLNTSSSLKTEELETLRKKSLLIVDDSSTNRKIIETIMIQFGVVTISAATGERALDLLKARNFDWILTDLHMEEMDGRTLARNIRKTIRGHNLPIIVLTSSDQPDTLQNEPFDCWICRPISPKKLAQTLLSQL
ncbi:MAG: response regulator [Cohaesibacteraceae bacterium]|nr:response regulator [Cohaesibacteraceae bacterium]